MREIVVEDSSSDLLSECHCTLALVVSRDIEIDLFKSTPYHTIRAEFGTSDDRFTASWVASEEQSGLDSEGRLVDSKVAIGLVDLIAGKNGVISECKQEAKEEKHPLTFSLSGMTALASKKFGYSAEDVLKLCQSLYEKHKLTSYPRTDCAYLPESQLNDAPKVLEAVASVWPGISEIVDNADVTIRSRTWDDSKVSAHHGIIPTMHRGDITMLDERERNIYELVVRSYLAQFYPVHEYLKTSIAVDVCGEQFKTSGKIVTTNGWGDVFSDSHDEDRKEDAQVIRFCRKLKFWRQRFMRYNAAYPARA